MKTRGTRKGILLSLEKDDSLESFDQILQNPEHKSLLSGNVMLELTDRLPWSLISGVAERIEAIGGTVLEMRPPTVVTQAKAETIIIARTVRSGGVVQSSGSVIILGDVNAGAEIVAEDDVIVVGRLRGIAHAGATGNENAVIYAQRIESPQLRIAGALAQGDGSSVDRGPEIAHLKDGNIVLRPYG
ncbi:MAG: hypothetical protein KC422_02590 [Trueperaceae bacterium]|nr:hypothetical protein [Trueperaceae bacterium]